MISKVIVSSLLLAALANGLVFKRDDGHDASTPPVISLPTITPQPILLPVPSISLSLPPLDPSPTSFSLPDPSISLSLPPLDPSPTSIPTIVLPDPSISLSLPPLDPIETPTPTLLSSSTLPSVVTTTVYVYPVHCSPTGSLPPTPSPSGFPDDVVALPQDDPITLPSDGQPTPIRLPKVEETPLVLPPLRRDDSVLSQLRALQQDVVNTWVNLDKGDVMLSVIAQLESIIAQAAAPGADGAALLKQAQDLVSK
jgi:hypothetical protein